MDCIFCKIIEGKIPSNTVYEDDVVKVIMDVNPCTNGHMLILPKKHYKDIMDIPNDVIIHIIKISRELNKLICDKLNTDGMSLSQNNGIAQEVKHFHLHVIPRYTDDGWKNIFNTDKLEDIKSVYTKLINK